MILCSPHGQPRTSDGRLWEKQKAARTAPSGAELKAVFRQCSAVVGAVLALQAVPPPSISNHAARRVARQLSIQSYLQQQPGGLGSTTVVVGNQPGCGQSNRVAVKQPCCSQTMTAWGAVQVSPAHHHHTQPYAACVYWQRRTKTASLHT